MARNNAEVAETSGRRCLDDWKRAMEPLLSLQIDDPHRPFQPGDELECECQIDAIDASEIQAVETSVLWYTEGKGDEDLGVHDFERRVPGDADDGDLRPMHRFKTILPNSPLSYSGEIVKVRWCARVRLFLRRGKELFFEQPFHLVRLLPSGTEVTVSHHFEDLAPLFPDQNPFSTWAVRPGAIAFRFSNGSSCEGLLADLKENGWWGEVVGPHGSGKSTLLATLAAGLEERGRTVKRYVVKLGEKQLAVSTPELREWTPSTQVIVEGYEALGSRNRKMIETVCKRQHAGLLVTCHESVGFPTLLRTSISLDLGLSIVCALLPPDCDFITEDDVRSSFERHSQNMRELLFEMYDLYEKRRPRDNGS